MSVEEARADSDLWAEGFFARAKQGWGAEDEEWQGYAEAIDRLILEVRAQAFWEVWQLYCPCGNPDHDPPMRALLRESPLVAEDEKKGRKELER